MRHVVREKSNYTDNFYNTNIDDYVSSRLNDGHLEKRIERLSKAVGKLTEVLYSKGVITAEDIGEIVGEWNTPEIVTEE